MKGKSRFLGSISLFAVLTIIPYFAVAATYNVTHSTNISQETILTISYVDACLVAVAGGNPPLAGCDGACACAPTNEDKEAYILSKGPAAWIQDQRRALRQARADEACSLYKNASDQIRIQVDALAGLPALPVAPAGDDYEWVLVTTTAQENTIARAYRQACEVQLSSSQPLPPGCTGACVCSPTVGQRHDFIFSEAFVAWFTRERDRIRGNRANSFCGIYISLGTSVQDQIDALLGLPPLP